MESRVEHAAYVRRETIVSVVINAVLSALFYFLVFRGVDPVPVWGIGNWVFDFVPQSFMIALMTTLVPGAMTRGAIRAGKISPGGVPNRLPANLVARAAVLAVASALAGTAVVALVTSLIGIVMIPAGPALTVKVLYGALLALVITPPGLRRTLAAVHER